MRKEVKIVPNFHFISFLSPRKHPIHFHFITDAASEEILSTLFRTWKIVQVKVSFYLASAAVEDDVSWVPNKHYSGIYGLLKLTLPKILPKGTERRPLSFFLLICALLNWNDPLLLD